MAMAIIMVWLTPVIMVGMAWGICTLTKVCSFVEQTRWTGFHYLVVHLLYAVAGQPHNGWNGIHCGSDDRSGLPRPKSITAGIRYTKLGMVCMVSKTGRTTA